MPSDSTGHRFDLGLRWLAADDESLPVVRGRDWRDFLAAGVDLPEPRRLWLARWWPLLALLTGPLALTGLMLWPERSGVHLLLFLLVFVFTPLVMLAWVGVRGLMLRRPPWWRALITAQRDPVVALWCARQSLLLQGLFCIAGLAWLWLALLTRQIIFYWGTSIAPVSARVAGWFEALSAGLLQPPDIEAVRAAEAGAITGWEGALLADSTLWAVWLTQVVALWVLVPWALLLLACQLRLRSAVARWWEHSPRLRHRYEQATRPAVGYRALQPEQPPVEPAGHDYPVVDRPPQTPGFGWRLAVSELPEGSCVLGEGRHGDDESTVAARAADCARWYVAAYAVPTGDLADLLQRHRACGGQPRLTILLGGGDDRPERLDALRHSWGVFLERNGLDLPVELVRQEGDR